MTTLEETAQTLRAAYRSGPISPLRNALQATDGEGAYSVQSINTRHWLAAGRRIVGRKIGLTALAVQKQLGVDQPDFGVLFDDMSIENGGTLWSNQVLQPKAEAEIALVLAKDLAGATVQMHDVIAATAYAVAAIEIVDSRIADWKITFADTVADNASSAFFVLGDQPMSLSGLDLRTCGMALDINGSTVSVGAGAACLGHPLNAAAWLARMLSKSGDALKAGDIVLTGALGPMVAIAPGDEVRAAIGGVGNVFFKFGNRTG